MPRSAVNAHVAALVAPSSATRASQNDDPDEEEIGGDRSSG